MKTELSEGFNSFENLVLKSGVETEEWRVWQVEPDWAPLND